MEFAGTIVVVQKNKRLKIVITSLNQLVNRPTIQRSRNLLQNIYTMPKKNTNIHILDIHTSTATRAHLHTNTHPSATAQHSTQINMHKAKNHHYITVGGWVFVLKFRIVCVRQFEWWVRSERNWKPGLKETVNKRIRNGKALISLSIILYYHLNNVHSSASKPFSRLRLPVASLL